ncbi:MAG: tRNA (adenosine(37)-N6)-dimethylallyltransferase [Microgenomates group bacterium]
MIIITGQTGTGKTKLAIVYSQKYNGEIINCDSRQVYQYLDIITGKDIPPDSQNKFQIVKKLENLVIGFYPINQTKIWLYDIVNPKINFSSYEWVKCASFVINQIFEQKKTPIIVGGTYFYLKHLLYGFETENIPPNSDLRQNLTKKSVFQLQKILENLNKTAFNNLNQSDKNNPHRLIRKIEIELWKKKNKQTMVKLTRAPIKFQKFIGLRFKDKENLKKAITERVNQRLKKGAIDEVKRLIKMGFTEKDPGLNTIGYKEIFSYVKGKINYEEAIKKWVQSEIKYTKRQLTFMKKDKNIKWIEV